MTLRSCLVCRIVLLQGDAKDDLLRSRKMYVLIADCEGLLRSLS